MSCTCQYQNPSGRPVAEDLFARHQRRSPERAGGPEAERFVDGLEYCICKRRREGPPWHIVPKDDSKCLELAVVLPGVLHPLVYDMSFVNKDTKDLSAGFLLDIKLLHAWVAKEVFWRGEHEVDL